jgi:L-seryl-tRNA(Ser) seleniumtransferase
MNRISQSPANNLLRKLPGVDVLLQRSQDLVARWGHEQVSQGLRHELSHLRDQLKTGDLVEVDASSIVAAVAAALELASGASLKPVLNLTGTVLHTNLGRASLPPQAVQAAAEAASQSSNLEFDLSTGKRGDRESHIESLVCELTGAEAATAVNNNAAAVLLILNTLALGRQVPVSRGELVEIGGSFRIPEVMQRSGCTLVEVGATNRTHLKDYRSAINANTALLMKVHASNYSIEGFTTAVAEADIASLARECDIPFVIDLGSGNLLDFPALGLPHEPTVADAIESGADLVSFSGDKLLGGPQGGIIAGKRELIELIKHNPLKRALRLDKMTLAALESVLRLYRNPVTLTQHLPGLRQLTRAIADIEAMAARVVGPLAQAISQDYEVSVREGFSQIGSGAMPAETIATVCLHIQSSSQSDTALRRLAAAFRQLPLPVIGRMNNGALIFDLRTLEDDSQFLEQLPRLGALLNC